MDVEVVPHPVDDRGLDIAFYGPLNSLVLALVVERIVDVMEFLAHSVNARGVPYTAQIGIAPTGLSHGYSLDRPPIGPRCDNEYFLPRWGQRF